MFICSISDRDLKTFHYLLEINDTVDGLLWIMCFMQDDILSSNKI